MKPPLFKPLTLSLVSLAATAVVVLILLTFFWTPRGGRDSTRPDAGPTLASDPIGEKPPEEPRPTAPTPPTAPAETATDAATETQPERSVADLLTSGDLFRQAVTPEVLADYRARHADDAGSLLTAFLATQDRAFLEAAANQHGHEPRVQLAVLLNDPDPAERADWLHRFKASDPSNALPNYLAARAEFESGRPLEAIRELADAAGKDAFEVYTYDAIIDEQELLLSAGLSPVEAGAIAMFSTPLSHLAHLKQLGNDLADLQRQYASVQDTASLDTVTQLGLELAGRLNQPEGRRFLIDQLVGIAIEDQLLQEYPQGVQPSFLSLPIDMRRADLAAQKQSMKALAPLVDGALLQASEATWATYLERVKLQGEWQALQWLESQLGPP